ncbi:MAG: methyltransferase domain-containing protein [Candidatus Aenigmarchaeota archaeon]|nr:methyltransferase domain-containing protein [Candidatus Aenigmarchaeota archaeon]
MQEYIFLLGKNRPLSVSEITMYYRHRNWNLDLTMISENAALVKSDNIPDANVLGGTIKIIKISEMFEKFDPYMIDVSKDVGRGGEKAVFGMSVYGKSKSWLMKNKNEIQILQKNIKDILKKEGLKSRFINFKGEVSPVHLSRKDIIDIVLFFRGDLLYVGSTCSFNNPLEFKKRDENKPVTVSTIGIPIRLAKIMLNLAGVKENTRIMDPFCGTGIILQEAVLMDASIIGSDIDSKMVLSTKRNLNWVIEEYGLKRYNFTDSLFVSDASEISGLIKEKVDAIVTEPYFGPALKKISSPKTAKHMLNKNIQLYDSIIKEFARVIKRDGYVCIVVPSYRTKTKNVHMNFRKIFTRHGFEEAKVREGLEQPFREEKKTLTREMFLLRKL